MSATLHGYEPRPDTPAEREVATLRKALALIYATYEILRAMYPLSADMPNAVDEAMNELDMAGDRLLRLAKQIENGGTK